ncbi:endosome-associated-trafficking regulator 1-like isoform X2 [Ptychodera flava]|uniref:endosome-associated-trafficking regulator 1-like isoform X2 n=1 Tax=Ptychodera flava TaxID=63121 RepID=UPI003969C885
MEAEEGGSGRNADNPFSFDAFVKQKSSNPISSEKKPKKKKEKGRVDSDKFVDIFSDDIPAQNSSSGTPTRSTVDSGQTSDGSGSSSANASGQSKSEECNPFSFKNFLKQDTKPSSLTKDDLKSSANIDGLPDIYDRLHDEQFPNVKAETKTKRVDIDSVILSTDSTLRGSSIDIAMNTTQDIFSQKSGRRKKVSELPDIFADLDEPDDLSSMSREEITAKVKKLKQENKSLKRDLLDAQNAATQESERVAAMLGEMKKVQQREAEDTQALENMVQQVEENLRLTTTRAVAAENMVTQLKQEVKALKGQMAVLSSEKQQLEAERANVSAITQTAQTAAEKLSVGATTAELAINQLLGGVGTLKLISETLSSIAVVTEEKDSANSQQSS